LGAGLFTSIKDKAKGGDSETRPGQDLAFDLLRVQRFCINDGPGIRTTVFFKGCPLNCVWCHNPESISREPKLLHNERLCTGCGLCVAKCPRGVHRMEAGRHTVDLARCTACGECLAVCMAEALTIHGMRATVSGVMDEILKDRDYYEVSGGGVTLSGGEPLMQPEAAVALAQACGKQGVGVYLDTSGMAPPGVFAVVAEAVDGFLYDIKTVDTARHKQLTGAGNELVLANFATAVATGKPLRMRFIVVPGLTDRPEDIAGLLTLAHSAGFTGPVDLMPYHRMGAAKYRNMGLAYRLEGVEPPTQARLDAIRKQIEEQGVSVTIQ
jgi:glycyl-radical enzyme activating protein